MSVLAGIKMPSESGSLATGSKVSKLGLASDILTAGSDLVNTMGEGRKTRYEIGSSVANARALKMGAVDALRRVRVEEAQVAINARANQGTLTATAAGGNIDPSFGSSLDLRMDSVRAGAVDIMTLRNNAANEALGLNQQAALQQQSAKMQVSANRNRMYTTLLTTGLGLAKSLSKEK